MNYIKENLDRIRNSINDIAGRAGLTPPQLIAVSKTHPAEAVKAAALAGQVHFGENRIQEALPKIEECKDISIEWHLIGHLQNNKTNKAAGSFAWIHSIDSLKTAERLSKRLVELGKYAHLLIEVNTSGDLSKNGISPEETVQLADKFADLPNVTLKGLMTIGPLGGSESDNRRSFSLLRNLRDDLLKSHTDCKELSMGMSNDYQEAILEGSTMLRIGSAIFGIRKQ